jgi:hypothetical protein
MELLLHELEEQGYEMTEFPSEQELEEEREAKAEACLNGEPYVEEPEDNSAREAGKKIIDQKRHEKIRKLSTTKDVTDEEMAIINNKQYLNEEEELKKQKYLLQKSHNQKGPMTITETKKLCRKDEDENQKLFARVKKDGEIERFEITKQELRRGVTESSR